MRRLIIIVSVLALLIVIVFNNNNFTKNYVLMFKTYNTSYSERINGKVCSIVHDRGLDKLIMCNGSKGYFFDADTNDSNQLEIQSYIKTGVTKIIKAPNSSIVYFVNLKDTLKVRYEVYPKNSTLFNGVIIR